MPGARWNRNALGSVIDTSTRKQRSQAMPLLSLARAATLDPTSRSIRFVMKDGCKTVNIFVSNTALEDFEIWPARDDQFLQWFKLSRRGFEQIASAKYDKG